MTSPTGWELDPGSGLTARRVALPDGRHLRIVEAGTGDPLVVFEAGLGAAAGSWVTVQRLVSAQTRTVSYDRAGYGGSDPDPADRTLSRMATDLCGLLDAHGESAPVVLVGHSLGGPILRAFAAAHADRVAGVCLVDATVAEVASPGSATTMALVSGLMRVLGRLGLTAALARRMQAALPDTLTQEDKQVMLREVFADRSRAVVRQETRQLAKIATELQRLQDAGLPPVPTVCLVGETAPRGGGKQRRTVNEVTRREMESRTGSEAVVVPGAGHLIPQEQPEATAHAILCLVRQSRARSAPGPAGRARPEPRSVPREGSPQQQDPGR